MSKVKIALLGVLFVSILVACSSGQPAPTAPSEIAALPSNTPAATLIPTKTATAAATITKSPTQTATPSPTTTPDPSCPEPGSAAPFAYPADTTELQAYILAYLNAGGQWQDLMSLLDELEIEHDWIQADMNGDEVEETAVYAKMFLIEESIPDNAWWIFQCGANQYQTIFETSGAWGYHKYFIVDDLDNDNRAEIIDNGGFAGSACDLEPKVWSWKAGEILRLSPDHLELELGCTSDDRIILEDLNGDNIKEMILVGETVGHLDYAPPRGITQTFTLKDTGYTLLSTVYAPSDLRVYVLDDAQRAFDEGEFNLALVYYARAANDDLSTIYSYSFPPNVAPEYDFPDDYQRSFSLFRLAIIQLVLGNRNDAELTLAELMARYPENNKGHEFVVLTEIFFDSFNDGQNIEESCNNVTEFIAENYVPEDNTLENPNLTSHFYWGSNIAAYYKPESFCPIFTTSTNNKP